MPDVKVSSDAQVYSDGRDLFMIIEGDYREGKETYSYRYDYEHDRMYLSKDYDKMVDHVKEGAAETIGIDPDRLSLILSRPQITTHVENDKEDIGIESDSTPAEFLPADTTPEEFADQVLSGEIDLSFHLTLYEETIKPYDQTLFEKLPNAHSISYQPPMQWGKRGICEASYRQDSIELTYLCTLDAGSDVYAGYMQCFEAKLDENGQITETESDPEVFSEGYLPEEAIIVNRTDDAFTLQVPPKARPVVFAPKPYNSVGNRINSEKVAHFDDSYKKVTDVFGEDSYEDYSLCILPVSDRTLYKPISISNDSDGVYHIVLEQREKAK